MRARENEIRLTMTYRRSEEFNNFISLLDGKKIRASKPTVSPDGIIKRYIFLAMSENIVN